MRKPSEYRFGEDVKMSVKLDEKTINLINDRSTTKVVASVGKLGIVNAAVKQSLHVNDDGKLEFLEFLESSDTNRNLIHSLWFDHNISVLLIDKEGQTLEIRGIPETAIIEGAYFQEKYVEVQNRHGGKLDLATIWVVNVTEIRDKDAYRRAEKEREDYPIIGHLDRWAK